MLIAYPDDVVDRGGADHSFNDRTARPTGTQRVLNQSWPFSDSGGHHARGLSDQDAEKQLDVTARIVLELDGELLLDGRATRWNRSHVYVVVSDSRIPKPGGVWLQAKDVRRRGLQGA